MLSYQINAKYYQIGSFLATEGNREREPDTNGSFTAWYPYPGPIFKRIKAVNDTSLSIWTPATFDEKGSWDTYGKVAAN